MSLKKLWHKYGSNPFDTLLKKERKKGSTRFLVCWNRGLGDIPLGLYGLVHRIRSYIPQAEITFLTRSDLLEGFSLLQGVKAVADPKWKRGVAFDLDNSLHDLGLDRSHFDLILKKPDPTNWLTWQLGKLTPKLEWNQQWDQLSEGYDPGPCYLGVHVQTETSYSYEKNWPLTYWKEFFKKIYIDYGVTSLLFGNGIQESFEGEGILDLRGKTSLMQMLSLIKNRCRYLLVPDSGVLSLTYYLNRSFPLHVVSLWADPKQGVLKQNVMSPNPQLNHLPLIAKNKNLQTITVSQVLNALFQERR